ncbi:hypothetical protein LAZ67_11002773 [Cordylochernes scorpioides]|uniref:RNA-directed DNA polymerase n=1 Tax=Cordylochernes scorpioides TaxID=51811 RepID=A0ABY6KZZ0_9ARAC|nr:hypothetical protein LAZ67_11002773 [Cordylochernes scorpioides]
MAQIQPPETFDFSTPNEWPKWKKRFERYLVVSGMKKKEEADKIDLFMYLMGDRADDIFRTFKFEKEEEATKIDSDLKAFDSHFCVRKNIFYERAKFNSRIQEDRKPVDEFITSLYKLADSCEFEGLHEQLIRDRIVVGVRDKALSERMQLDSELTLEKARPSTSQKVNQVKFNSKKQSPKQQQQSSRKKEKSAKTRSRCPKCGGFTHREGQACRAEGQKCNLCSKTGHFANCWPDKQAKTAEVKAVSELDEEIGFLLEVSAVEDSSNLDDDEGECRRRWAAEIQVNGKQVKFKLDSQADVTCVPLCLFKKIMGQQRLVESDINIRAAEFSELQTVGMFISTLRDGNYEIKEKIYVIRRLSEPLLSRRACELLNLARRIEVVATRINPIKDEMLTKIFEAQQEDTTLKAVVNYLEQGWPDKKKMSHTLLSYWHVKDELGVQNRLLMRSCRLVIPASMKLEILDKLHAGHFGITKTRLRARETVWWPGISEESAETVRKCSVCIQEAVSKHEPLIPTNIPTRPWQKIGMDLFKFENKWCLVVIDFYSRFPEMIQLDRLTANVVVRSCKSIFARHGIPETVVSDNGTQFGAAREFANFARQYGFTHVTSSPRFQQSNGMAEAGVKIAKLILKKNQDPSLGLLEYRSTPLENGYSPAEFLMGRKLRTTLAIAPENLNPRLVDSQTLKRKEGRRRKDMKSRYDRRCGATDMEELSEGDTVWITDMRIWGIVKQKASTPRSYMVDTPVGTLCRNRFHLHKGDTVQCPADPSTPTFSGEELVENEKTPVVDYPSNDSEDGQIRTRNLPSAMRPVPHSDILTVPEPPKNVIFSDDDSDRREQQSIDTNFEAGASSEPHLLTQGDLNDLALGDIVLEKVLSGLLDIQGAIIDSKNEFEITPLHRAAWSLNSIIVHTLIEAGADVNLRNEDGETPSIMAANTCVEYILEDEFDNKYLRTLELLLKNAGDIDLEIFLRNSAVENNIIICRPIIQVMIKYFILQHPTENKPEDIPLPKDLSDWWEDCQSQVHLMQCQILGKSDISLYRILTETDQHKVIGFLSNDATGLRQAIERNLPFYNEIFPIYAEIIKECFNISVKSAISLCECFSMAMKLDFTKSNKFLMLKILKQLHCLNWEHYLHTDILKEWTRD